MAAMDERASQQLAAVARVDALLVEAGIAYWVFGGWAVDFHVGAVTRPHDDVDMAVWRDDLPRIAELLEGDGWRHAPQEDEDGGTGYEREGVRLELTFLVRDGAGAVVTPLREAEISWPHGALAADRRELAGVRAPVMGVAGLALWKSSPRAEPEEAAKDKADFERLARLLER